MFYEKKMSMQWAKQVQIVEKPSVKYDGFQKKCPTMQCAKMLQFIECQMLVFTRGFLAGMLLYLPKAHTLARVLEDSIFFAYSNTQRKGGSSES